jgi:hypothetical protein
MVENVGYAPTQSILQGLSGTMPVFPMVPSPGLSPGSSTLEASRSVFKLRGLEVDARQRLPRCKIDFADRRFGSLPCERFKWCGVSKLHRVGVVAQPLYRRSPLYYGSTSAKMVAGAGIAPAKNGL